MGPAYRREIEDRTALRRRLRELRRQLGPQELAGASAAVARHLLAGWERPVGVAGYLADDGEVDPSGALAAWAEHGTRIALPGVVGDELQFRWWQPGDALRDGRFGIREPAAGGVAEAGDLELVLVPLVAFGPQGSRLGRGKGYYDRAFAGHVPGAAPVLIGLAHSFQYVGELRPQPWDVALDVVVTPEGIERFAPC